MGHDLLLYYKILVENKQIFNHNQIILSITSTFESSSYIDMSVVTISPVVSSPPQLLVVVWRHGVHVSAITLTIDSTRLPGAGLRYTAMFHGICQTSDGVF